jgi:hypothetical protein
LNAEKRQQLAALQREGCVGRVARASSSDANLRRDATSVENDGSVRQQERFVDVVGNEQDRRLVQLP